VSSPYNAHHGQSGLKELACVPAVDPDRTGRRSADESPYLARQDRGPDSCIDAVGAEAHGSGSFDAVLDKVKSSVNLATDRLHVLRQIIMCCRKGGHLSIPGVYLGFLDKVPFGAAFGKGLTFKMGQTHAQKYLGPLLERIEKGEIDPSFVITHRLPLREAPAAYKPSMTRKTVASRCF
jgi:threonine dehydrogenase-like Zn-dependent dehydrogenase